MIMCIIADIYIKLEDSKYEQTYSMKTEIETYATIVSEAKETEYKKVYNIKIKNKKFILKVNKNAKIDLQYGDFIHIKGTYEPPSTARNYKGFDYSKYLKTKAIYGTIYVQGNGIKIVEKGKINIVSKAISQIKNSIIENSQKVVKNENLAGLLVGILVGDTSYADDETINNFKNSSLAHMLAVSGQHVGYVILAIGYALKMSKMGKRAGNIVSICILFLFMLITGLTPSVFRAGIMAILIIISKLLHKKADIYTSLALSMLLILSLNPFSIYDIGLWLSYGRNIWNSVIS